MVEKGLPLGETKEKAGDGQDQSCEKAAESRTAWISISWTSQNRRAQHEDTELCRKADKNLDELGALRKKLGKKLR